MQQITVKGTITDVFPVEHIGNFRKRIFWIKEHADASTPQVYQLEAWNQDVEMPAKEKAGEVLNFSIEIRGKKWEKNGRAGIINTLRCIGIFKPSNVIHPDYAGETNNDDDPPF